MIDHEYTDDITCPYCGYKITEEPWEYGNVFSEDETRIECPDCEKEFASTCYTTYSFSTHTVDLEAEKREREERRRVHQECADRGRAEAAKWLPGTRVRVRENIGYANHIEGREGVVPNKEMRHSGYVNVTFDAVDGRKGYDTSFMPKDLKRL